MASKTFYLKYRPQKIAELDSADVREGLRKVLESGKVPHALLFVGPRGTGKTSAARIFAKAINCQKVKSQKSKVPPKRRAGKSSFEPCNQCEICQEITKGIALDLIEIDAASNRGIDDIRDLREKIKLAPVKAKYKVYIVDEVHMLTTEAFNALLKTLEEPPAHAVFILCTTEPKKLPQTIISRCLRFNFKKASLKEIVEGPLKRAIQGENLKVEKGVLEEIAQSVDGSFRDAHKILEQLSFGGPEITLEETKKLLGKIEALEPEKLLSLLAEKNVKAGLMEIDRVVGAGADLAVYVHELLDKLRLMMLGRVGLEFGREKTEGLALSLSEIRALIGLFSRAAQEMKTSPIPQLPLELVVVEWGDRDGGDAEAVQRGLDSGTSAQIRSKLSPHARKVSQGVPPPRSRGDGLEEIKKRWDELLAGVKPMNHSVEALLRATRPAQLDGDFLILEVFYKFHKERLESEKCRSVVEEVVTKILGMPIKLKCILGSKRSTDNTDEKIDYADRSAKSGFKSEESVDIIKTAEGIFGV